jgi:PAS domain S-box-containing protein
MVQALARLHDLVALVDRSGRLTWLSDGLVELCGSPAREGMHWLETLAAPGSPDLLSRLGATGQLAGERVELRGRGGQLLPARVSAAQLEQRGCDATVLIFRLDAHESVAQEFHRRVETLSAILDGVPDGVVVLDRSRFITWANPAMAEITGYAVKDLIDQPLVLFLRSREDIERIASTLGPVEPDWKEELEVRRCDGQPMLVSVNARLLSLPDGTELGAVAYVRDVTDRRHIEAELARRAEELQNWVNAVSHDLRSPLVAVLGFARLLAEDYGDRLDEQGLRFLRRIEEAGRTMESLVHDLLEFARIGRSEPKRVHVDPREVLLQLQAEIKPRLEEAQVDLRLPGSAASLVRPNAALPGSEQPRRQRARSRRPDAAPRGRGSRLLRGRPASPHGARLGPWHRSRQSRTHLRDLPDARGSSARKARHRHRARDRAQDRRFARRDGVGGGPPG